MRFAISFFSDLEAKRLAERELSLDELAELCRSTRAVEKAQLPLLKLAHFGGVKTSKGSLRHDHNLIFVSGAEGDYDAGLMNLEDARARLSAAGILSILYTSPSHRPTAPRWRVLAPFSRQTSPEDRNRLLARLNGVLGGCLSAESWTRSQSFYYGAVDGAEDYRVIEIEGQPVDQLEDLDEGAIGPTKPKGNGAAAAGPSDRRRLTEAELSLILENMPNRPTDFSAGAATPPWFDRAVWVSLLHAVAGMTGKSFWARECFALWSSKFDENHVEPRRVWDSLNDVRAGFPQLLKLFDGYFGKGRLDQLLAQLHGVHLSDFVAYMPQHAYVFLATGDMWPMESINSRLPWPSPKLKPSTWLDRNAPVEQMTWGPGQPQMINDRLIVHGGWVSAPGCRVFNLYRPPTITSRAGDALPWVKHVTAVFPEEKDHIIRWLAHRVQRPAEKINHALVLAGAQGIGKDTILEPVKKAIGPWNLADISPVMLVGRFNGFVKSVILRISEARDLGEVNRFTFYEHSKAYIVAPPDILLCDEKHIHPYPVPNVTGVIITTNHLSDGIYLPADDRRHFVAWSVKIKEQFKPEYWQELYRWYDRGGNEIVAHYLHQLDLSTLNPKAPPPQTDAFWTIVGASRSPEDAELADILEDLGSPETTTLDAIIRKAREDGNHSLEAWLKDRKNSRAIPHRLEACGYVPKRNPDATDGLWRINGKRQVVYRKQKQPKKDASSSQ